MDSLIEFINITTEQGNFDQAVEQYHLTLIEASKEVKHVFIKHDAPQGFIDNQDELIRFFFADIKN